MHRFSKIKQEDGSTRGLPNQQCRLKVCACVWKWIMPWLWLVMADGLLLTLDWKLKVSTLMTVTEKDAS